MNGHPKYSTLLAAAEARLWRLRADRAPAAEVAAARACVRRVRFLTMLVPAAGNGGAA